MQTTQQSLTPVLRHLYSSGGGGGGGSVVGVRAAATRGGRLLSPFYRGMGASMQQRMLTRGPMFLFSELATQVGQQQLGMERDVACFVGSAFSGYLTGSLASIAEYRKVLISQQVVGTGATAGFGSGGKTWTYTAILTHVRGNTTASTTTTTTPTGSTLQHLRRRMNAAGTRNGIFDSAFFGTQNLLQHHYSYSPTASYTLAAATAVVVDYSVDMTVKRMMVVPPSEPVLRLLPTMFGLVNARRDGFFKSVVMVHRGLSAKVCEFAVSYGVVGFSTVYVMAAMNALLMADTHLNNKKAEGEEGGDE
jgi:hypothetical protein